MERGPEVHKFAFSIGVGWGDPTRGSFGPGSGRLGDVLCQIVIGPIGAPRGAEDLEIADDFG